MLEKQEKRIRRHKRVRAKISGTAKVPRLCVFRSAKHIYVQLIDDETGKTLLAVSDRDVKPKTGVKSSVESRKGKVAIAYEVGKLAGEKTIENKIKKIVFDRGGYQYHGRIKAIAEGAREGGINF